MYLAVDPGKHVGIATFNGSGEDLSRTIMPEQRARKFFITLAQNVQDKPDRKLTIIVEDFRLSKEKAIEQAGSDMPACRLIGALELIDDLLDSQSKLYFQSPSLLKPTALKWAGMNQYLNYAHVPDDVSAYSHGKFWLIKNDVVKHPIFSS